MAKKPVKYTVLVGCNVPDPSGARDERGRPVELRFEPGAEIEETAVSPASLASLLAMRAIQPSKSAKSDPPAADDQSN